MSTSIGAVVHKVKVECVCGLHALLSGLEADSSLLQPARLLERLVALDRLDAGFGGFDSQASPSETRSRIHERVSKLRSRLEAGNAELYQSVRSEIVRWDSSRTLLHWLEALARQNESSEPVPGLGFDCRDELVSGVLQLREPSEPNAHRSPEMVPYQPTPVRHILRLIRAMALAKEDVFVDLGSGLGHVPVLVSLVTGSRSLGIEAQAGYVARARECARSLDLCRVQFLVQDARETDISSGTVFYLYSPFNGSILAEVLRSLRMESRRRLIKICSLGPCTLIVANETWLKARAHPTMESIAIFDSQ